MALNYDDIRKRLRKIKEKAKMNGRDFYHIYDPEKDVSTATADNYASALINGTNAGGETGKTIPITLEGLQNLIDSGRFEGLTMNYLLYGDDTPEKAVFVPETSIDKLSVADFFKIIGQMILEMPDVVNFSHDALRERRPDDGFSRIYRTLEFNVSKNDFPDNNDLGIALSYFFEGVAYSADSPDYEIRKIGMDKVFTAMSKDKRFTGTTIKAMMSSFDELFITPDPKDSPFEHKEDPDDSYY